MKNCYWPVSTAAPLAVGILIACALYGAGPSNPSEGNGAMAKGKNPMTGMVFCDKMSTGELCPGGTVSTLKLSEQTAVRWRADIHEYDKAVEAANNRLLAEAKTTLTPKQYSQVKLWFAKGLNPLMNELLIQQGRLAK